MLKGIHLMKMQDLEKKAWEALVQCLAEVPFLDLGETLTAPIPESGQPDFLMRVRAGKEEKILLVEVKNNGQPRYVREAVNQLLRYKSHYQDAYGIFIAPYISPQSEDICRQADIGFVDFAGNCFLFFQEVFIHKTGNPNPFTEKRYLRSLYSPKAGRILRVLLTSPSKVWKVEELAGEAGVSLGHVANIKKLLGDREWVDDFAVGFSLRNPEILLKEWSENYSFRKNQVHQFYTLDRLIDFEHRLGEVCNQESIRYGLTGFSGAARHAPAVRYQRAMAYINGDMDRLILLLGLKPVQTGANVSLLIPYDEGVYYGSQEVDGISVIHPIQIYLDLKGISGRGEEAADVLLEEVIRKQW